MYIVPLENETLDSFLFKANEINKSNIVLALERFDKFIYSQLDHSRFKVVRIDERTILSSYGSLRYKRRYYYDNYLEEYCYLLDNHLQIPKSKRMTNELILRMLDLASKMSYKEVGESLSSEFTLSKYTVWKTINEVLLETYFDVDVKRNGEKIHVQIDEKYIGMTKFKNKRKYYTLTIFAGIERNGKANKLLNKTVISSCVLNDLKKKVNDLLVNRYKVSLDEEIFISGDFATYIQCFGDAITCCKTKYVPDKFHVYKTLRDTLPDVVVDDISLNDAGFKNYLISRLKTIKDGNAKKLLKMLKSEINYFKAYLDPEYLGCSQEGQNSHIYAPRFGKRANKFSPSTVEKLALIREAKAMNAKIILVHKNRKIPEHIDISEIIYPYKEETRYVIDTTAMKQETRKLFNAIKYGEY